MGKLPLRQFQDFILSLRNSSAVNTGNILAIFEYPKLVEYANVDTPAFPLLVVMRITPFAPREP